MNTQVEINSTAHIILEIGPGEDPFPLIGRRTLRKDERYIGIEKDRHAFLVS